MSIQKKKDVTRLAMLFTVCGALLLIFGVGGLIIRCRMLELRLDEMFMESMMSHTIESGEDARQLIDDTKTLLEDSVQMLEGDGRPLEKSWADPLLKSLALGGQQMEIHYLDQDDLELAELGSEEKRVFQQLQKGTSVVGGVVSDQDGFYFLVVRPVMRDNEVMGAVRAKVNADLLFSQGHDSILFHSIHRIIADDSNRVVCGSATENRGLSLAELSRRDGLSQQSVDSFLAAYHMEESGSYRYETEQGEGYAAWSAIGYNGWRMVQFSQSPDLRVEQSNLVQTLIMLISLLVCAGLAGLNWWQRSRLAAEKLRYSALAEFKDTLIFEYDCQKDSMEFTSNALDTLDLDDVRLEDVTDMKNTFPVFHPDDLEAVRRVLWDAETMGKEQVEHDRIRMKRKDGTYSWYRSQYKAVFDSEGKVIRLIGTLTDISAQIDREIELRNQAQQDPLTGVYNRAGVKLINARLEQISRGILFMLDMDDFKFVNDTYGHAAGDRLLMAIGEVLRETFRTDDIVARVGGDEFVAFLSGSDSRITAEQKGRELLERVRDLKVDGITTAVTVSVGAASAPALGRTYEVLSQAADEAMYQVKHSGKGGFLLR